MDKFIIDNKIDNNKSLYNLYTSQMKSLSEDKLLFSNQQFLLDINKYQISDIIFFKYQRNFLEVIKFINLIMENIINNLHSLPYSIKCFCQIL